MKKPTEHKPYQPKTGAKCGCKRCAMSELTKQQLVAYHEAEVARLQGEVGSGQFDKSFDFLKALNKATALRLGLPVSDFKDLEHVQTPPCPQTAPQAQVDTAYVAFLEARKNALEVAMRSACYYIRMGAPERAVELLSQSLVSQ